MTRLYDMTIKRFPEEKNFNLGLMLPHILDNLISKGSLLVSDSVILSNVVFGSLSRRLKG